MVSHRLTLSENQVAFLVSKFNAQTPSEAIYSALASIEGFPLEKPIKRLYIRWKDFDKAKFLDNAPHSVLKLLANYLLSRREIYHILTPIEVKEAIEYLHKNGFKVSITRGGKVSIKHRIKEKVIHPGWRDIRWS